MKKIKGQQSKAKKKVDIKDLPTRVRDAAIRGGAEAVNTGKIKKV